MGDRGDRAGERSVVIPYYSISVETLNMATREGIVCESDGRAYIPASQRPNVKHGNTRRDCVEGWKGIPTCKPADRYS